MKRIKRFFVTLILLTVVFSVGAQSGQSQQSQSQNQNALRDVVDRDTYGDNWFISVNGTGNILVAEQDAFAPMMDRLKFGGAFDFGKWFNPNLGARLQVMGGSLRGFNDVKFRGTNSSSYYVHTNMFHAGYPIGGDPTLPENADNYTFVTKSGVDGFWQDFNYASATIDLMLNFTNLMRGRYRENSPVDFIPFVGLGGIHAFNNQNTTPSFTFFVFKVGLRLNFNITNNLALYLEPQANLTDKEFDGYVGSASGDGIVNLGLGLQYTFNKQFTSLSQIVQLTADEIDRLNKKINDTRYVIENHQDILERQQNLLDRLEKCCDEENKKQVVTQVVELGDLPEYARFSIDSYRVEPAEQRKIDGVAEYLKNHPNSKLLIIGYADKRTGNPRYNMNLSRKRVEAVASELKRLGINPNRIISEWKGDVEQPFPQNEWNRVVVMVERK